MDTSCQQLIYHLFQKPWSGSLGMDPVLGLLLCIFLAWGDKLNTNPDIKKSPTERALTCGHLYSRNLSVPHWAVSKILLCC